MQRTLTLWKNEKIEEEDTRILRRKADEIPIPLDEKAKKDIATLVNSFLERDDAVGLAAPQIGISKRVVVFKNRGFSNKAPVTRENGNYEVLINPRITQYRGEQNKDSEGCLSCPDISVDVFRYPEIKVKAYDEEGRKVNKRYTGFLARIVQHEIDHLDGRLIVDCGSTVYFPEEKQRFFKKILK
jgi:peptide deformylase